MPALKEELGDLLLQVVFHAQMAEEEGLFDFEDVAEAICNKMIERHPHVFADAEINTVEAQIENWEKLKAKEREKNQSGSVLDNIPLPLPALTRAEKLGKRAAKVGFDWPETTPVFAKIEEELAELKEAMLTAAANPLAKGDGKNRNKHNKSEIQEELGDMLFACVNLARHLDIDPEEALRRTNRKFESRFRYIEKALVTRQQTPQQATLTEMEQLWNEAKELETR